MLQSTVQLPPVDCDQCVKESEKKKYFWVSYSFFGHKNRWQKITLNLTIKHTLIPKNPRSFLSINRKASLVTDDWIQAKWKWKLQYYSDLPLLWVISSEENNKKTTIKWTFLPWNMAGNFGQRMSSWKWKKTKITERREVWEGCFSAPARTHLHLHGDLCTILDSQDNCMLRHCFCRVARQVFQAKKSCRFHMLLQLVEVKPVESMMNAG